MVILLHVRLHCCYQRLRHSTSANLPANRITVDVSEYPAKDGTMQTGFEHPDQSVLLEVLEQHAFLALSTWKGDSDAPPGFPSDRAAGLKIAFICIGSRRLGFTCNTLRAFEPLLPFHANRELCLASKMVISYLHATDVRVYNMLLDNHQLELGATWELF